MTKVAEAARYEPRGKGSVQKGKRIVLVGSGLSVGDATASAVTTQQLLPVGAVRHRIFLLSPANASGARARLLLNATCATELGLRLRGEGVRLGELFSFMSSLY